MTYKVLARKWRPRSFDEMAGQTHVLKTLINALDNDRLHHAYLFTGTRGVGKTTIARILAKCLNCESGVTSKPCGECSACKEIDEGRFIDLIEVDAASKTKVEDTRELLDNVQYSPTRGRYKVYLIDEVHMLSGHSFNALLKTLEEPPPHVKFLLATTDPQKLPITVLSRCLQFNLKNLSPEQLVEHLTHILKSENIPFEESALWHLGRAARGSVRDSLTLLDQAIAYSDGNVTDHEVSELLGSIDQGVIHKLVESLAALDGSTMLNIIKDAAELGADFNVVLEELLSYLHRIAIAQVVPDGIDNSQGDRDNVINHAQSIPAENIQLYYQIGLKGREDLPLSIDARSGLEMTLLRMLAFTPDGVPNSPTVPLADSGASVEEPLKKKSELSRQAVSETKAELKQEAKQEPVTKSSKKSEARPEVKTSIEVKASPPEHLHSEAVEPQTAPFVEQAAAVQIKPESAPEIKPVDATKSEVGTSKDPAQEVTKKTVQQESVQRETGPEKKLISLESLSPDQWVDLFYQLEISGITRNIAANAVLSSVNGNQLKLTLMEAQSTVYNDGHQREIQKALSKVFNESVDLTVEFGEIDPEKSETPSVWRRRKEAERHQAAVKAFEEDDNVKAIIEKFSGTIVSDSIEPLTPKNY